MKCPVSASSLECTVIVSIEQSCILWHIDWAMPQSTRHVEYGGN